MKYIKNNICNAKFNDAYGEIFIHSLNNQNIEI